MGIPQDGTGINCYVIGQTNMSHGQSCRYVIVEPLIYFRVCHGTLINKFKKQELLVRKSKFSLIDTSTNKQLLQKL